MSNVISFSTIYKKNARKGNMRMEKQLAKKILISNSNLDISDNRKIEIEKIVNNIISKQGFDESTSIDIVSIVKKDNFLVQRGDIPIEITGYLAVNDNEPVDEITKCHRLIVVNNKFTNPDNEDNVILKKSRFITAHEYGHFILHKKNQSLYAHRDSGKRETTEELEADYFARSILMPTNSFLFINNVIDKLFEITDLHNEDVKQKIKIDLLSRRFKVTKNKVQKRLGDIGVISSMNN